jgi:hypothetical protein
LTLLEVNKTMHEISIHLNQPAAFALVLGGVFPLAFTTDYVLLIDRNILGTLSSLESESNCSDLKVTKRWLNFLNSPTQMINPALCAFEGNQKAVPSPVEFRNAFIKASREVATYLPKAKLIQYEGNNYDAAYKVIQNLAKRYQAENEFLVKAVPTIIHQTPNSKLRATEEKLLFLCKEQGLNTHSLVVLAILSCLYEAKTEKKYSIGRRIIKPKQDYGCQQAHNAISDLRALEFLVAISPLMPDRKVAFCTCDKALAAFWCALQINEVRWQKDSFNFNAAVNKKLFPRLEQDEIEAFVERLRNNCSQSVHL